MGKFTKGGWEFDRSISRVVDAEGEIICATGDSWNSYRNSDANAALIAAAPEMYEMLKAVSESNCRTSEFYDEISSLLAQARGEK